MRPMADGEVALIIGGLRALSLTADSEMHARHGCSALCGSCPGIRPA
jgi:hypothetical protein